MWDRICAYLTFTRKERLGVLVLLGIILLLFVLPYFIRPEAGSADPAAYQKYKEGIRDFQSGQKAGFQEKTALNDRSSPYSGNKKTAAGSLDYQYLRGAPTGSYNAEAGPDYTSREKSAANEDLQGKKEYEPELFYFDPNRLPAEGWRRLGLPDKLILTISHYLQKGGSFRTATDLKKLYGLKAQDYDRLFPYVRIRSSENTELARYPRREWDIEYSGRPGINRAENYAASKSNRERSDKPPPEFSDQTSHTFRHLSTRQFEDLDINLADSAVWSNLPGISFRLACRITRFRDRLGGFYAVDQVKETFGLPDSTFQLIRPFLHCSQTELRKINLNVASLEALQAHPYIRWALARQIIQYRTQHGGFKSVAELQQLALLDTELYKRLEPYLEVK
jgi:DNA uptake protein ComE-like DNA-binding protein